MIADIGTQGNARNMSQERRYTMNANEIVATIRKLMPCINDCMDLYEYERQALTQAADLITAQQGEIAHLTALSKDAVELLGLADDAIWRNNLCNVCGVSCIKDVRSVRECQAGCGKFKWKYADRYEELKKRMEKLKGEEEDRQSSKR